MIKGLFQLGQLLLLSAAIVMLVCVTREIRDNRKKAPSQVEISEMGPFLFYTTIDCAFSP